MKVLAVEPGKVPYETEVADELKSLQRAVEGNIEPIYPYEDPVVLICNEEAKLDRLPLNRALKDEDGNIYDIIAGKFFVAGLEEGNFSDLSPDLMAKYKEKFLYPETILHIAGRFVSVKQMLPKETDTERIVKSSDLANEPGRNTSMREQLRQAQKQTVQAEPKEPDKKHRSPERS